MTERLQRAIAKRVLKTEGGEGLRLQISVGSAFVKPGEAGGKAVPLKHLLRDADRQMYADKRTR